MGFARIEEVEAALPLDAFRRAPVPWEASFLAGKAFVAYRQRGGTRTLPLPDFFIGAHAAVAAYALLTRDPQRVRTYFPQVHLITPPPASCAPQKLICHFTDRLIQPQLRLTHQEPITVGDGTRSGREDRVASPVLMVRTRAKQRTIALGNAF